MNTNPSWRLQEYLRRMPCGVAYRPSGYALHTGLKKRTVFVLLDLLETKGVVRRTYTPFKGEMFYEPVRVSCTPDNQCDRPACRIHREAKRLEKRSLEVAAEYDPSFPTARACLPRAEPIDIPNEAALRAWWRLRRWILVNFPSVVSVDVGPTTARSKTGWIIVWRRS